MANKRMFCLDVVDTDLFLEMPTSSQALYFQLGMRADDDGFVSSPKKIAKITSCGEDDLRLLASKGYIIPFDSGVIVVTHWGINNNKIKGDRYKPTIYSKEKSMLTQKGGVYSAIGTRVVPECIQNGDTSEPQNRLDKNRIDKSNNYSVHFEEFWKVYPRKKEKAKAHKCYLARLKDGFSEEELLTAAQRYAEECREKRTEERYIKHGATFLSASTPFTDYLAKGDENDGEPDNQDRRPASDYYTEFLGGCSSD